MRAKAAVLYEVGKPVVVEQLDLESPGPGEVMVKVAGTGVCHSDYNVVSGYRLPGDLPAVMGHEGAGIVAQVGPGVTEFKPGDHVIFTIRPMCGRCRYCATGRWNLCIGYSPPSGRMLDGTTRFSKEGRPVFHGLATFCEFTVVWENHLVRVRDDVPLDKAALVGCAVMTGVGAVVNRAKVEAGATVAVWGCGGVGLNVVQGAQLAGASRIIAVDVNPFKLEVASRLGATGTVNAEENDPVEAVRQMTAGGVDYAFEVIGNPKTTLQAFEATCAGGTCVLVGAPPEGGELAIPMRPLFLDRTVMGSSAGSGRPRADFPWILDLYMQGRLKLDELITRTRPLEEVNQAFRDMEDGKVARTVLVP